MHKSTSATDEIDLHYLRQSFVRHLAAVGILSTLIALAISGCGATATRSASELFYPRHGDPLGVGDAALLEGELLLTDDGCAFIIGTVDGSRVLPLWPANTSPRWMNGFTVVGPGRELLFVANAISRFGGSEVDQTTAEELAGPIPEACLADTYWVVTSN